MTVTDHASRFLLLCEAMEGTKEAPAITAFEQADEGIWIVSFMRCNLGFIDLEQKTLQPTDNPFGPGL